MTEFAVIVVLGLSLGFMLARLVHDWALILGFKLELATL